jgi:hypothetical protein
MALVGVVAVEPVCAPGDPAAPLVDPAPVVAPGLLGLVVAVAPGAVAPGVAPGTAAPGVETPGAPVVGVVAGGLAAPGVAGAADVGAPAGTTTVRVTGTVLATELPDSPASDTSAAVSPPRASTIVSPSAASGARQLGIAARRVRAAPPQLRHHSCSDPSGAPHSGQLSPAGVGAPAAAAGETGGAAVTLTRPRCRTDG